jgi:hypothetical protein
MNRTTIARRKIPTGVMVVNDVDGTDGLERILFI